MDIGDLIKQYRKEKKLSQLELAKLCNLSESYISMIEANKRAPDIVVIEKLCKALDKHLHDLMLDKIIENLDVSEERKIIIRQAKKIMNLMISNDSN